MTDKELRKLSRAQLLQLLLEQTRRADALHAQLEEARSQLSSRSLQVEEAGNLADAALRLNGVFYAAQNAADQYLENIRSRDVILDDAYREAEAIIISAQEKAAALEAETSEKCRAQTEKAQKDCQKYWDNLTKRLGAYMDRHPELKKELLKQPVNKRL